MRVFVLMILYIILVILQCCCYSFQPQRTSIRASRTATTTPSLTYYYDYSTPQFQPMTQRQYSASSSSSSSNRPENLLTKYSTRRKRRSIRRIVEISSVLFGEVLRPLTCSLLEEHSKKIPQHQQEYWDAFWSRSVRGRTNAQRVVEGLQRLGPVYVKLGQLLATRPDFLNVKLADALTTLQDRMRPFDNATAKRIIQQNLKFRMKKYNHHALHQFMMSLSPEPVAAASIAQVYKGYLPEYGHVAVKVKRPGIRNIVERDAILFHSIAQWIESLPRSIRDNDAVKLFLSSKKAVVDAVDEFLTRVLEDTDFEKEAENIQNFYNLYSQKRGTTKTIKVVVPELIEELCSENVLVMEWIDGKKLTDINDTFDEREIAENLALVKMAIECTLSQLLDEGVLHADPHTGNLLKVPTKKGPQLGYLDFGLVSTVPQRDRDAIVCAVVELVFARNFEAVADLFADMELLPKEKLLDPVERQAFLNALRHMFDEVLEWPCDAKGRATAIPTLHFEKLLGSLTDLIGQYEFTIPPYFLNNARALATLEGIGKKLDPSFNVLRVIYPYAINRLMCNPSVSDVVEDTFMDICHSPKTRLFDPSRVKTLLNDWAVFTGHRRRRVFFDLATSTGGRLVITRIVQEWACDNLGICLGKNVRRTRRRLLPRSKMLFRL